MGVPSTILFMDDRGFEEPIDRDADSGWSNIWTILSLAFLGIVLTWIILEAWRYLQAMTYGGG